MRNALQLTAGAASLLVLIVGCASTAPRAEVTAKPTPDELPDLSAVEGTIPLDVGVQRDVDEPRLVLVSPFEKPELTPEERAILGEDQDQGYDPLELYRPAIGPAQGVELHAPRPLSGIYGQGGTAVGVGSFVPVWGIGAGVGGPATGITVHPRILSTAAAESASPHGVGPRSAVRVGNTGPIRRVAASKQDGNK